MNEIKVARSPHVKVEKAARLLSGALLVGLAALFLMALIFLLLKAATRLPWSFFNPIEMAGTVFMALAGLVAITCVWLVPVAAIVGVISIIMNSRLGIPSKHDGIAAIAVAAAFAAAYGLFVLISPLSYSKSDTSAEEQITVKQNNTSEHIP